MIDAIRKVQQFHEAFGVPVSGQPTAAISTDLRALRVRLLEEELEEYKAATAAGDIVAVADALTDLAYVLFGTYVTHGLQDVAEALFDEVHRSNMSKLDENGRPLYREDGKVLKSARFSQPNLVKILASHELAALYAADQRERADHPAAGTPAYRELRERDQQRRERVSELVALDALSTAEDYYHAAMIFQHGDSVDDAWQAHVLARKSAELGHDRARWLAAAALDRWLMYQGQPQKYGTQFVPDGKRYRLWDWEPGTTDEERSAWDVPPLADQLARAERMTANTPQPPMVDAPAWLKEALARWALQS